MKYKNPALNNVGFFTLADSNKRSSRKNNHPLNKKPPNKQ
jgi:hypothetical protein